MACWKLVWAASRSKSPDARAMEQDLVQPYRRLQNLRTLATVTPEGIKSEIAGCEERDKPGDYTRKCDLEEAKELAGKLGLPTWVD